MSKGREVPAATAWEQVKLPKFPAVKKAQQFDVVIVGGGITGLTTAYLLKQAGKRVAVVERRSLAGVDTGLSTAHLTAVTDLRLPQIVKRFGKDAAAAVWHGGSLAIDKIEQIARELSVDCEFRRVDGYLHSSIDGNNRDRAALAREAKLAAALGIDCEFLPAVPYIERPGIRFASQAKFHPLKYLAAVAKAIPGDGSAIFEKSDVSEVTDEPLAAVVAGKKLTCDYLVIATHVPLMGKTGLVSATLFQTKLASYSSYVVAAHAPHGLLPEASFWDTSDPYYYLRVDALPDAQMDRDRIIFGGADHKTGQEPSPAKRFDQLRARLQRLVAGVEFDCQWSGQVVETADGLPYIGESAERQFIATGFAGNGMTFGTLSAIMACDRVTGRENPWQELFAIDRKNLRGGTWRFLKENIDYPYYLVRDRFARAEASSPYGVLRGEGKIIIADGQKVACSRDEDGKLSAVSAICTHLGCVVAWNDAEKTWDCPCHGSRFKPSGEVLAGPAEAPLEEVKLAKTPATRRRDEKSERKSKPQRLKPARSKAAAKHGKATSSASAKKAKSKAVVKAKVGGKKDASKISATGATKRSSKQAGGSAPRKTAKAKR